MAGEHSSPEPTADAEGDVAALRHVSEAEAAAAGPAWERLVEQRDWYSSRSAQQQRWFQGLKVTQIVVAAAIPVVAAAGASAAVAGALGAVIVVLEGIQQLFQFQQNWIAYRGTAEALKHEKYLYLSRAGDYGATERPDALLAERVESLVSQEHDAWATTQRERTAPADA